MSNRRLLNADYTDAGAGPLVVPVHASMSGARQWGALTQCLQDRFTLRAPIWSICPIGGPFLGNPSRGPAGDRAARLISAP